ncbi:hypothetical protein FQZ97_696490 [compost metagenome]
MLPFALAKALTPLDSTNCIFSKLPDLKSRSAIALADRLYSIGTFSFLLTTTPVTN